MNEVISQPEKMGGRPVRGSQGRNLINFMDAAGLVDIGYNGCKYTWTNVRDGMELIQERLDRALANSPWLDNFPHTKVHHLPRIHSDHSPILVSLDNCAVNGPFPFRCKEVWLSHPNFSDYFVQNWKPPNNDFLNGRNCFLNTISSWNHNIFGNLNKQKRIIIARIEGIQIALSNKYSRFLINLEADLLANLNDIYKKERIIWAQKAGINWRKYADYNTKYFHTIAKIKKSKGKILTLKNDQNEWVTDQLLLKNMASSYFQCLFTSQHIQGNFIFNKKSNLKLTEEEIKDLSIMISIEEVRHNLFFMDPIKTPGPDGIQPIFFQKHWNDLGATIYDFCVSCFRSCSIPKEINKSYIALIPKIANPSLITEFRPIGLCNTIYKLITKIISSRVKSILNRIISPLQSSFIKGRGIEDNVILVKEMAHHFHKAKKRNKIMALKLDITKAYDSLEWDFIRETLLFFDFPKLFINLIMSCITSSSISVLWNGEICDSFTPSRGIRQGDPLSSYIFVLCLDRLSTMIEDLVNQVMTLLEQFGNMSGLKLSFTKSTLIFPQSLNHNIRRDIAGEYGIKISSSFGKYLGVDIRPHKLKINNYKGLLDKTMDRIRGWQAKILNMAGRCTLIRSVLSSFPLYAMQTSLIPSTITYAIEKCCRKFLWNKVDRSKYMARLAWDKVTLPTNVGGLGIRRLKDWNLAFMAKLGWTILDKPDKLWVRILKEKYLKNSSLLNSMPNYNQSPLWRDILKGNHILQKGLIIGIGNGKNTSIWYHHWIGDAPLYTLEEIKIPELKAHWFVNRIIRNGQWYLDEIQHLLATHIRDLILAYPLSNNMDEEDFIRWKYSKNGDFEIKSAYHIQLYDPSPTSFSNFPWKTIWKIKCPYKYKMLLWNCCHEILPVAASLNQRIPNISPICSRCQHQREDHLHLFRDCPQSSVLWSFIFQRVWNSEHFQFCAFYNSSWKDWINFNLHNSASWKVIFIVAIWHIWISRNKAVFDLKMKSAFSLYNSFFIDWNSTNLALQGKSTDIKTNLPPIRKQWMPPLEGYMKLNIDGAWKSGNVAGGGGVFRRHTGSWFVGFSTKFRVHSPLASELYALREGLKIAKNFLIDKLEVETDALNLKLLLDKVKDHTHHELGPVLREVTQLLGENWIISFSHIPKTYNRVAHALAAHSLIMVVQHKLHYIIPSCAKEEYEGDFEKANPAYAEEMRRNARDQVLAMCNARKENAAKINNIAQTSSASEIVFGSIVSTINQVMQDKASGKDGNSTDKGKGKAFVSFVVGSSTIPKDIEIVEVEDDDENNTVTNN
ncbi:uncharacterized protein [Spinacia oleracea]|uniref:Reverse transcriptase domain-containing protein n=1 Tax=Spinacia oleracea TaxID=3562 RepID=A0ABM3RSG6_SPIOL|nr:uncharacterized protein LOC130472122 [Spinacia oleracea]